MDATQMGNLQARLTTRGYEGIADTLLSKSTVPPGPRAHAFGRTFENLKTVGNSTEVSKGEEAAVVDCLCVYVSIFCCFGVLFCF